LLQSVVKHQAIGQDIGCHHLQKDYIRIAGANNTTAAIAFHRAVPSDKRWLLKSMITGSESKRISSQPAGKM
jgi:hypothetical protein